MDPPGFARRYVADRFHSEQAVCPLESPCPRAPQAQSLREAGLAIAKARKSFAAARRFLPQTGANRHAPALAWFMLAIRQQRRRRAEPSGLDVAAHSLGP